MRRSGHVCSADGMFSWESSSLVEIDGAARRLDHQSRPRQIADIPARLSANALVVDRNAWKVRIDGATAGVGIYSIGSIARQGETNRAVAVSEQVASAATQRSMEINGAALRPYR